VTLLSRLEEALRSADGEVELSAQASRQGTTRFANSRVTQTGDVEDITIQARVALGHRVGAARTNRLDGIGEAMARARELAAAQPERPFDGFDDGRQPTAAAADSRDEEVAAASAARRAELVAPAFAQTGKLGLTAAGLALTGVSELAVATTAGCRRWWRSTLCKLDVIASDGQASARLGRCSPRMICEPGSLSERACERALLSRHPIEVKPGAWDVILEPPAVAEMLEWLALTGLGARTVEDGSSCLAGREGERIAGSATLYDDAVSGEESCPTVPFDSEGTPKRKVTFFDAGVARGPVHDRASAARAKASSTGHAPPLVEEVFEGGPAPLHLHLAGGSDSVESLLARVERGLYVARFHYVNGLLDTRRALMTGTTRDGLFLVENGVIGKPVRNLRWTESLLEALGRCDGMTQAREVVASGLSDSYVVAPALLIRGFGLTG
jgi:predicted Zn-dependent protease